MVEAPKSVDIAMATYHRERDLPELLPKLLSQGDAAAAATGLDFAFRVVVVDNDPLGGARGVVEANGDPRLHYVVETNPGVTNARNRALAETAETDVLAFIDDDEIPHEDWLARLLTAHLEYSADVVAGPVYPIFDGPLDLWVDASGIYDEPHRAHLRTGDPIKRAGAGNLLLDLRVVRRLGITFDQRFGLTGGEDSFFTGQLANAGARMVWCAEAVADHRVPTARANRDYTLNRRLSLSNAGVRSDVLLARPGVARWGTRMKWLLTCAGAVARGSGQVLAGQVRKSLPMRAAGEIRVMGGIGGLAGSVGAAAKPYKRKKSTRKT